MSEPVENPHVALNNAREEAQADACRERLILAGVYSEEMLGTMSDHHAIETARNLLPFHYHGLDQSMPKPDERHSGAVIDRPTGERAELWQRWARGVERDAQAKRASDKKKRAEQQQNPL